jgi:hypothetical protein
MPEPLGGSRECYNTLDTEKYELYGASTKICKPCKQIIAFNDDHQQIVIRLDVVVKSNDFAMYLSSSKIKNCTCSARQCRGAEGKTHCSNDYSYHIEFRTLYMYARRIFRDKCLHPGAADGFPD